MSYDCDGKRSHRMSVIRFLAALALPAILLSSAIAVAEWGERPSSYNCGHSNAGSSAMNSSTLALRAFAGSTFTSSAVE